MRSSIVVGAFAAFNLAAALFMPSDQPDGVYGIRTNEDGTEEFVLISNATMAENKAALLEARDSGLSKDAPYSARDILARGLQHPTFTKCAASKKELHHGDTDWVNSDLDRQCDVGAASRWTKVVAKRGCSVAYYCNFSTYVDHDSLTCTGHMRREYSKHITNACGWYKPGWGRYNSGFPWGYVAYSYGYENLCDGGQNFCS